MKIYIGPYRPWIGPYQLANILKHVGVSEDRCYKIGCYLSKTKINDLCEWIYAKHERKIKIRIDPYDTWNLDHTFALIILPALKQLKNEKHGTPKTDDEDVPEGFRHKRWQWIFDEIIFAFESIVDNDDIYWTEEKAKRVDSGLRLFGKYYRTLWD